MDPQNSTSTLCLRPRIQCNGYIHGSNSRRTNCIDSCNNIPVLQYWSNMVNHHPTKGHQRNQVIQTRKSNMNKTSIIIMGIVMLFFTMLMGFFYKMILMVVGITAGLLSLYVTIKLVVPIVNWINKPKRRCP